MASMTPDFLSKILFWKRSRDTEQVNISKDFNKWEDCVNKIQKILIWDDPVISSLSLVAVNLLFWLLIHFECKFYGLVFTALLTLTLHQLWIEHIQNDLKIPEGSRTVKSEAAYSSNARLLTMAEISRYASRAQEISKNACLKLRRLRQDQPGTFCVMTCICFLFLSIVGRSISGVALLYSFIMIVMVVPGACIHFLPPQFISSFTNIFNSSHRDNDNDNDVEVEEYLPETSGEALALLNLAGELQLTPREDDEDSNDILLEQMSARTNDTAGSSCSKLSFCPDASAMPSHENSLDFLDFDMPSKPSESKKSDIIDSEFSDIHFQSRHFNGDSSDDEEDEFSKGLEFKQLDKNKRPKEEKSETVSAPSFLSAANVGRNIISMGANILTHVVKQQQTEIKRNDRESSSDTDSFELISEEDM